MLTRTVVKALRQRTCLLPQRLVRDIITSNGLAASRPAGFLAVVLRQLRRTRALIAR